MRNASLLLDQYLTKLRRLRSDTNHSWPETTRGRAPHKPLLLLCILDLVEEGVLTQNFIEITPELGELFGTYWSRLMSPERRSSLATPFFHLRGESFWHLIPQPGKEEWLKATSTVTSLPMLREVIVGAQLDKELWTLMCQTQSRQQMRVALVEASFAPEVGPVLLDQSTLNVEANDYAKALLEGARTQRLDESAQLQEDKPAVRDQGFRRAVVTAYARRCAMCGICITTPEAHTVVDAAHIQPWSVSHNDDPRNGLALCRLCHWTFDEGLMDVSAQGVVLVSRQLTENGNLPGHLVMLRDRPIFKPSETALWPDAKMLAWHSAQVFRKR